MKPRVAVVGAGSFGRNHLRVIHQSENAELAGVLDSDPARAEAAAARTTAAGFRVWMSWRTMPTQLWSPRLPCRTRNSGARLMEKGIDVLIEKPIADSPVAARDSGRHREAYRADSASGPPGAFQSRGDGARQSDQTPLFFEIHRLSEFSPRSLDVDVVLDLMIHDIDIVLALTVKRRRKYRRPESASCRRRWISRTCACNLPPAASRT